MTHHKTTQRQLSASDIERWRDLGDTFDAASMSGGPNHTGYGQLDTPWADLLEVHLREGIDYVVYSYRTPIAWHTSRGWVVVTARFSQTTSARHQPIARQLRPQRTDLWCSGDNRKVTPPPAGASTPWYLSGRKWGFCAVCKQPVRAEGDIAVVHPQGLDRLAGAR